MSQHEEKQQKKYATKQFMGLIQDKMDVGMAKLRSDEGVALDIAIVKATLQDEVVPKEKHVRSLKAACSGSAPRKQTNYVIHGLSRRFEEKQGWVVTLKTLIVFHRLMREVDPSFQEEIIRYQDRTGAHRLLRLETFADHTTKNTWDYSAWIRAYSVYLDERLGVFKSMRFDPEAELAGGDTRLKTCSASELLDKLPQVQRLLSRLIACVPEGTAQRNDIVLQSCGMVLREVKSVYRTVCEGIINLADKFFEMERADATRALDIYRDNVALNDRLNTFFATINNVSTLKGAVQFPTVQALPADFQTTMEEYIRDAPKGVEPGSGSASASQNPAAAGSTGPASAGHTEAAAHAPAPAATRVSTIARTGGTTSAVITGIAPPPAPAAAPAPQIAPPAGDTQPPKPAPTGIDLLGDDFATAVALQPPASSAAATPQGPPSAAPALTSPTQLSPQAAAQPQAGYSVSASFPPPGYGPPATSAVPQGFPVTASFPGPGQPATTGFGQSAFTPTTQLQYSMAQPQQPAPPQNPFAPPGSSHASFASNQGSFAQHPQPTAGSSFAAHPMQAAPVPAPAPAPAPVDFLGDPFGASAFPAQPAPAAPAPVAPQPAATGFGFEEAAFGAPAPAAPAPGLTLTQQSPFNPFGTPAITSPTQPSMPAPAPQQQQQQPAAANPWGEAPGWGAPAPAPNPYAAPVAAAPGAHGAPAPAATNPFAMPAAAPGASNPFGAPAAPAGWGAPAPQAQGGMQWGAVPMQQQQQQPQRKAADPLGDLGDLFGKPAPTPAPALRDMRQM